MSELKFMKHEFEAWRHEAAKDEAARDHQKLQLHLYRSTLHPRVRYDDDDPNFKEEKVYFDDELDPLRKIRGQKPIKSMDVKEILKESTSILKENLQRNVFKDGGEDAVKSGQRYRAPKEIKTRNVALIGTLIAVAVLSVIALGNYEMDSHSARYLQQAIEEKKNRSKEN